MTVDESGNVNSCAPSYEDTSVAEIITDLVADTAIPGIPAPVRRNLFKALGQLTSAAIDFPVAFLTGKADEQRAETAARIKLINRTAEHIARQMQIDPEYARVAVQKFGHRVLREQVNLDMIGQKAAKEIRDASDSINQSVPEESGNTINDDWLNVFETEARLKSTEEMQVYFSKVLAGEIRKPGTYSTRTVKILASLDQGVANEFARLCSMCISMQFTDIRVPSLGGNAGANALQEYGLPFATLNLLNEHGLIISDYNSWHDFTPCFPVGDAGQQALCRPFSYQGRHWTLMPMSNGEVGKKLKISGVALSQSGRELFNIVKVEPMDMFTLELAQFFEKHAFRMVEVGGGKPRVVSINVATGIDSQ